jgi:hypothetical protein
LKIAILKSNYRPL